MDSSAFAPGSMPGAGATELPRVRRPRTREVVPTSEHPNFKDHGRTVDRALLRVLSHLQKKYGEAWASEAGQRQMICEDTGHMPGLDTVRRALDRLERQGVLEQHWLVRGGILPDGSVCTHGTRLIVLPQCRRARRGLHSRAARREGETRRIQRRMAATLAVARASAFRPTTPPDTRAVAFEQKRREDTARALELARQWDAEDAAKRPPD